MLKLTLAGSKRAKIFEKRAKKKMRAFQNPKKIHPLLTRTYDFCTRNFSPKFLQNAQLFR
jgi:hypothetical protein